MKMESKRVSEGGRRLGHAMACPYEEAGMEAAPM